MGVLLLVIIFVFYILSSRITKVNILSPTVLTCIMFFISTSIASLRSEDWGFHISPITVFVVCLFLLSMLFGEICAAEKKKSRTVKDILMHDAEGLQISNIKYLLIIVAEIALTYIVYKRFIGLAVSAGYTGNVVTHYVRTALQEGASWGEVYALSIIFVTAVGYIFMTLLMKDLSSVKHKKVHVKALIRNCIPIIPAFIVQLFTTNRSGIIQLFAYAIIVMLLIRKMNYGKGKLLNAKTIFLITGIFTLCLALFVYYGTYSGKTNSFRNPIESICVYVGGSMISLSDYLSSLDAAALLFGTYRGVSFPGIIEVLGRFGLRIVVDTGNFGDVIMFNNGYGTNVYTAIGSLICDFGIMGMILFEFVFGFLMKKFLVFVLNRKKVDIVLILFGYFSYDIIGQIFANYALKEFLSVSRILFIFCIFIAYRLLAKKTKKTRTRNVNNNTAQIKTISA